MIAIIPARGGSKGLPGKNLKRLNGKPLLAYTIEAAKNVSQISRVIISTDDKEIAEIAVKYGAECPFMRPGYLANDEAKSIDVIKFTISELEKIENTLIDTLIVLQPTSPLRASEDINAAINIFKNKNADSVISYCQEHHPITWHKYISEDGKFQNIFDDSLNNRQKEKPTFYPNGAIYIFKKDLILRDIYYSENSYAYIMPRNRSVDIDTIEDFEYAEFLLSKK
ncbi:acylneuraminate cytidylyltransferase family protein [Chryseobacterium sp. CT-SW4]|uniref:acylneuraminate cytidylyltransferase family protein n=1 Tax=Chryseobacterium sp. SW-1 TaxID=3157343 RepID=UPI003B022107